MPGILDYKEYNDLFATVKDVIEHFPSEQYTLPYSFNNLGTEGYTATIHYQSFIVDRFTYTQARIPDFSQSLIKGYFPAKTISQPSTSTLQLPKDMYVYPMYPERLVDTPVTLVSYRFYKGTERFTRQLLLIENWEPGMPIGNPADDPDYIPIDQTGYKFAVSLALNTSSFTTTGTLTVIGTGTAIGAVTTSTEYFDNTATLTIKQGSNILYSDTANFINGSISLNTIIGSEYFPSTLSGHTYTITTGSFTTSTFSYSAQITESYSVVLNWQSLKLPDGIIIGGSTSTIFSITTTLNQTTNLVPVSVSVIDTATSTATIAAWSNTDIELRAQAQLQTIYPESADQVEFWADYSPDYAIQTYVLPEQDEDLGATLIRQGQMPRKLANNQVLLTPYSTSTIGQTFQFPYILNNGFSNPGQYSLTTNTAVLSLVGQIFQLETLLPYYSPPIPSIKGWNTMAAQDIALTGTGTYTASLSVEINPAVFHLSLGIKYYLQTWIELIQNDQTIQSFFKEGRLSYPPAPLVNSLIVNNTQTITISTLGNNKIRIRAGIILAGANSSQATWGNNGWDSAKVNSQITYSGSGIQRLDTGTYTIVSLTPIDNGAVATLNKNWQVSPYRSEFYIEQGSQQSLSNGITYYPSKQIPIAGKLYEFVSDELDLIAFYGLDKATPQPFSETNRLKISDTNSLWLGSSFNYNSTQTYRVVERNLSADYILTDPPWYTNNPEWWDTIRNQDLTLSRVGSGQSFTATTISSLVYTKGVNTPYYDGAYVFNKFRVSGTVPAVDSQFRLAGTMTSPTTTTFVITEVSGNEVTFVPAYSIATTGLLPQWQQDNEIYNHFLNYEIGRPIGFLYDVYKTSQGKLLACYGETTLIFDTIPYNLRIGATFRLTSGSKYQVYTVVTIDAFRNILTVSKGSSSGSPSSYDFVDKTATFTNPAAPATTSTFLGTATQTQQTDDIFLWKLRRTLPQGQYSVSARVRKSVLTGTNVAYVYPTSSTQNYSVSSSDGISAGLYMTLTDQGATDRVVVTSNVNTARDPAHFYVYPTPVSWKLNGGTLSTSSWVRQGTSFIQTATLVVNKGVLNPTFYADWPGTLNYSRTYQDQLLFTPDQIAFMPANTTTLILSVPSETNLDLLSLSGSVQIQGTPYPLEDDYVPDGTIAFSITPQNYNYVTGQATPTTPTRNIGTGILSGGATTITTATQSLWNADSWPTYYRVQGQYSGDVYRSASTASSGIITVVPNYFTGSYCNEITDNTNGASFNNGTFLQLTRFNNPDPNRVIAGDQWIDVRIDAWLEPLITNTWTASLSLTNAVVKPWIVESINDFGRTNDQYTIDALYSYNLPQPPNFPTSQYQFKVYHYENAVSAQRGYEVKRSMRFVAKFRGGTSLSKAVNWVNLYLQIGTPGSFNRNQTGKDNCFRLRGRVVSVNWSNTDPY